jgi:hypothetical protein
VCDELYRMLVRTREGRLDINRRKSARKRWEGVDWINFALNIDQ